MSAANELAALYAGLLHPLLTPAHALGLVALGSLIGQQAPGRTLRLQSVFTLALASGLLALALAVGETPASDVLLATAAASGALAAAGFSLPLWLIGLLAAAVGAAIGLDSPPAMISLDEAAAMLVGTLVGGALTLALIAAIAGYTRRDWQKIALRILGSWSAASALLALAVRFAAR